MKSTHDTKQKLATKDFANPYLPLPDDHVLESLLKKAGCCYHSKDNSNDCDATIGDRFASDTPPPSQESSSLPTTSRNRAVVKLFCGIRSWLILHQPLQPNVELLWDDLDTRFTQVTNSIQLLASALILHRCWLQLVPDDRSSTTKDISQDNRYLVSDVIQAIHTMLPQFLLDAPHNERKPSPAKRRRPLTLCAWRDPQLVEWNVRRAMDQYLLFHSEGWPAAHRSEAGVEGIPAESQHRYHHFVRTFRRFAAKESHTHDINEDTAASERKIALSLLKQLLEIRMVVQHSIEAYNDFRTIFRAVLDSPDVLSSIPLERSSTLPRNTEVAETPNIEESNMSPLHIYQMQKHWLSMSWILSLYARVVLPILSTSSIANSEYCHSHSIFCSAVSVACLTTLLLGDSREPSTEPMVDIQEKASSTTPVSADSVLDMILRVVGSEEFGSTLQHRRCESQSPEVVSLLNILTKSKLQSTVSKLLQLIASSMEHSEASSSCANKRAFGTTQLEDEAVNDLSKEMILPAEFSKEKVQDLFYCSIRKVSSAPNFHFIDQTTIPIDFVADALGCNDADYCGNQDSRTIVDTGNRNASADAYPASSPIVSDGDESWSTSSSLLVDKLPQATAVLASVEELERRSLQCYVTPVVITADMELTEWAMATTFVNEVRPSSQLFAMMDELVCASSEENEAKRRWRDVVFQVLNKTLLRLLQECVNNKAVITSYVTVIPTGQSSGHVKTNGEISADMQLCKAMVALYYHALEAILYEDKDKAKDRGHSKMKIMVLLESFHQSLLACCFACVFKAISLSKRLRVSSVMKRISIPSILYLFGCGSYEFLKVSDLFLRSLSLNSVARGKMGSPLLFHLPLLLRTEIELVDTNIIDSLLWLRNNSLSSVTSFTDKILEYQKSMASEKSVCLWPPQVLAPTLPEEVYDSGLTSYVEPIYPTPDHPKYDDLNTILYVTKKLLKLVHDRIEKLCRKLQVHIASPVLPQVWVTFRHLLRNHVDLFFDRHIDQWILCTLYGVSRSVKYQPELKFAKIIEAYVAVREHELGSTMCQRIVRHIRISAGTATDEGMGNIISLYNKVFVPTMKDYLLNSESLRRCTIKLSSLQK